MGELTSTPLGASTGGVGKPHRSATGGAFVRALQGARERADIRAVVMHITDRDLD